jgi:hypothetical protein
MKVSEEITKHLNSYLENINNEAENENENDNDMQ